MNDPISTIDLTTLERWTNRAYREAARSWQEFRAVGGPVLRDAAESADAYHRHLKAELDRRYEAGEDVDRIGLAMSLDGLA